MFKPVIMALLSLFILLALFIKFDFGPTFLRNSPKRQIEIRHVIKQSQIQIAQSHCEGTLHPALCVSTVSAAFHDLHSKTLLEIIRATVTVTVKEVNSSASNCSKIRRKLEKKLSLLELKALDDCLDLFSATASHLAAILVDLSANSSREAARYDDVQTLLSGAMTNQDTCLDGFPSSGNDTRQLIEGRLNRISERNSIALAMMKRFLTVTNLMKKKKGVGRGTTNGYPIWLKESDRGLLRAAAAAADLVVAQDGSGNFRTINEALAVAPNNSKSRFVIYIRNGTYYEHVEVESPKTNIMFLGDGIGKTTIKGNRSMMTNWTTYQSATVAVVGNGFLAKGITFENDAGPTMGQAVALRCGADLAVFFQCSFVGYQDTLYVHSLRQFFRECDVYGTVDFIFGNAAVVIQNSNLYARHPKKKQKNVVTAQDRDDPNQNTAISIINCTVAAAEDLVPVLSKFRTFLGRPWKNYSRTVFMVSNLERVVDPKGWLEWDGDFALDTLYYGEYMNRGTRSDTRKRVTWHGYKVLNVTEASQFSVENLIQGNQWLPATGVTFYPNLTQS